MIVRFGYVSLALGLKPHVTASSTMTFKRYSSMSPEARMNRLKKIALANIQSLHKILQYNLENDIHFYRITSTLIPLTTHPETENWDYKTYLKEEYEKVSQFIIDNNMRVDLHPGEFSVINSVHESVFQKTVEELEFQLSLLELLKFPHPKLVSHISSMQPNKLEAAKRFVDNFYRLPTNLHDVLLLENDDKTFNAEEMLSIAKEVKLPMVLDIHHHLCNPSTNSLDNFLEQVFHTWDGQALPPKVHISTPKDGILSRHHADFIDPIQCINFLELCKSTNIPFLDVMLESKQKDLSLFKLISDIKSIRPQLEWRDRTSVVF